MLAALSGALFVLSFPKFGHAAVAWVALVPLLLALPGAARAFGLGYLTGLVSALGLLYWTALVVVQYGGLGLPVGVAVMVLLCLAVALFTGLFAWALGWWLRALGPAALLLAPFAWVATEALRAYTFYRFSWCLLGYSQQGNLPVIQIASYTAVYGVSFLVAGSSAVLAYLVKETRPHLRRRAAAGFAAVLAAVLLHGALALSRPLPEAARLRVGLVQASILQEEKWAPLKAFENVELHLELTRRAAAQGARVVIWPESAVPFYYDRAPALAVELRHLVQLHGIHLIFGNDDREDVPGGADRVFVGAKMLTPAGELTFRYHKMRLVPFGEYVPLEGLLSAVGVKKLVQEVGAFTPGTEPSLGRLDGHAFGAFICYEAIFPDLVRKFTVRGADLLVNVTNDAWYGRTSAPYQHLAMAAFRAVENRKYLLRAANTGITAVVDPRGRVLDRTELFEPAVLVRDVPVVPGGTFYSRHGDVFAWGCFGVAAAVTAKTFTTKTRRAQRKK